MKCHIFTVLLCLNIIIFFVFGLIGCGDTDEPIDKQTLPTQEEIEEEKNAQRELTRQLEDTLGTSPTNTTSHLPPSDIPSPDFY